MTEFALKRVLVDSIISMLRTELIPKYIEFVDGNFKAHPFRKLLGIR